MHIGHGRAWGVCARTSGQGLFVDVYKKEGAVIRTQWAATRHRSLQNARRPRQMRGKRALCPRLLRCGRSGTRCLRQNRPSCASHTLRPRMTRALGIGRTGHGSTCAAMVCRSVALPCLRPPRRPWRGGIPGGYARPTNRARGSA